MDKRTKKKRFELLIDMLENHKKYFPKVKFDLDTWAENNKVNSKVECLLDGTCGTAACAVGSAMLFKPFNRRGLKGKWSGSPDIRDEGSAFVPVYKKYSGWDAVKEFFDITNSEAEWLFSGNEYIVKPSSKKVAKRAKAFVDNDYFVWLDIVC